MGRLIRAFPRKVHDSSDIYSSHTEGNLLGELKMHDYRIIHKGGLTPMGRLVGFYGLFLICLMLGQSAISQQFDFSIAPNSPALVPKKSDFVVANSTPPVAESERQDDYSSAELSIIKDALPYAKLSDEIYSHDESTDSEADLQIIDQYCQQWKRFESERFPLTYTYTYEKCSSPSGTAQSTAPVIGMKEVCSTETVTKTVDNGFHAEAYRAGDTVVVVYEGTTTLDDWIADFAHVVVKPEQYDQALRFSRRIVEHSQLNSPGEKTDFIIAGHSLGGGLAQYTALSLGLNAFVFNPAALWLPTAIPAIATDPVKAGEARLTGFIGKGKIGGRVPLYDAVSMMKLGDFLDQKIYVPVEVETLNPLAALKEVHSMKNILSSLEASVKVSGCASPGPKALVSLVLDTSGSMGKSGKLDNAKEAAKAFVSELPIDISMSLLTFSNDAHVHQSLASVDDMKKVLKQALDGFVASGGTNMGRGLELSFDELKSTSEVAESFVVLMSDGADNINQGYITDKEYMAAGVPVCTVGFGVNEATQKRLQGIADDTKGCFYTNADEGNLVAAFQRIVQTVLGNTIITDTTDMLGSDQVLSYDAVVSEGAEVLKAATQWSDSDSRLSANDVSGGGDEVAYPEALLPNLGGEYLSSRMRFSGYPRLHYANEGRFVKASASHGAPIKRSSPLKTTVRSLSRMLSTVLISPDGREFREADVMSQGGRYEHGRNFQMLELPNPSPGVWRIETHWVKPPPVAGQVRILVTEKTNVTASILPFDPKYRKGQPVTINVMAKGLGKGQRKPLRSGAVRVAVQKPGVELIRLVKAQSSNWSMYQDVLVDNTRELVLYDDGMHDDYSANDGIYGNTFRETDLNGAYLVRASVAGEHAGQAVSRELLASFQVGPIENNKVTNSQTLAYMRGAKAASSAVGAGMYYAPRTAPKVPAWEQPADAALPERPVHDLDDLSNFDPLDELEQLQGDDPMDAINDLLKD